MARDQYRFRRQLRRLAEADRIGSEELAGLRAEIAESVAARQTRLARLPLPKYPEDLPVVEKRAEIAEAISQNQVVIVCGETGSGKTTQLPKVCLELKRGAAGMIGHTQPRRIAARTVAARIASELDSTLGHAVGYKVRFSDKVSPDTCVKLMTDGILLAETQGDRFLTAYDTLIIDEAHERSLNIDFLLGFVKQLLPKRPDLKLIITSATIDAEKFSRHFGNAPVIEVSGRLYPVEVRYRPVRSEDEDEQERDMEQAIVDAVDEAFLSGQGGDALVFLPGEREIRDTAEELRKHAFRSARPGARGIEILPLFARLSFAEQEKVFRPTGERRVVLATNVAETSLTVPNIRFVVDTGLARVNRYSYRNKVEQLLVEKISRASANQRAGRCGRVMSGVCFRLYSEEEFASRPEFADPEILRSSLASVILRMKALRLGDVEDFPYVDPPAPKAVSDGYQLLMELGAVDEERRLTPLGAQLAKFPIDPRIARMIVAADRERCLTEALIIASALSVQDPRERPLEKQDAADQAQRIFQDERSDFMSYLKLWAFFEEALRHKKSNRKLAEQCHAHFLSYLRLREWRDIHTQLYALVTEMGMRANETPAKYEEIHRALLPGLLGNIGSRADDGEGYLGARGIRFAIFPGSALRRKQPRWVVAAELMETARLYARCVAAIEPEWLERAGGHLCKRTYLDPHWEKSGAQVVAYERLTLYGLVIVPRRRVHYGAIDPGVSRELFIRGALVAGEFETRAPFFQHNRQLMAEVAELEHKSRRTDVLVTDEDLYRFYDARIPGGVCNGAGFEKWRREAEKQNPKLLYMSREDLMRHGAGGVTEAQFPETMEVAGATLELSYRFEPGHPLDGVTVTVPLALLNQLEATPFDWLVPGLLREKVNALIRSLPKQLRRAFVPLPECVTDCLMELDRMGAARERLLTEALSLALKRLRQVEVPPEAWDTAGLPAHLHMNYRVTDDEGKELAAGRDLQKLKDELGGAAEKSFAPQADWDRSGITRWDFGALPQSVEFERGGRRLTGYPALVDDGAGVRLTLLDTADKAQEATQRGIVRLYRLEMKEQMKFIERNLPGFQQMALAYAPLGNADELREELLAATVDRAVWAEGGEIRDANAYQARGRQAKVRLPVVAQELARVVGEILTLAQAVKKSLDGPAGRAFRHAESDMRRQLENLVFRGFITRVPYVRLQHTPRYLKAMQRRLEKLPGAVERDQRHTAEINALWKQYEQRLDRHRKAGRRDPRLEEFRWQLEELRVSLFAQELKTPYPVSVKRLQKLWQSMPG
ncbi:MAG: ATP-dependent RNA helicase HrpA [Betaproteobacteria bacterium]|nr:ATP-dependent RNA helicase HrpA [Betaproteobacteria bacterium]